MNYFDLIEQRCSYRGNYTEKKIPVQDINLILAAALLSPTGMNAQSTEFVVVDDQNKIDKIAAILEKPKFAGASAVILCIVNIEHIPVVGDLSFEIEDCSAAVMSMLYAITDLGYATVWIDGLLKRNNNAENIGEVVALPDNKRVQILLPVGEPAESAKQPKKKGMAERVSFNTYEL